MRVFQGKEHERDAIEGKNIPGGRGMAHAKPWGRITFLGSKKSRKIQEEWKVRAE